MIITYLTRWLGFNIWTWKGHKYSAHNGHRFTSLDFHHIQAMKERRKTGLRNMGERGLPAANSVAPSEQHPGTSEALVQSNVNANPPDVLSLFWKYMHWNMPTEITTWTTGAMLNALVLLPWLTSGLLIILFPMHIICLQESTPVRSTRNFWSQGNCICHSKLLSWYPDFVCQPVETFHEKNLPSAQSTQKYQQDLWILEPGGPDSDTSKYTPPCGISE